MKLKHNNKGFSLVELIVVIAIMAILGGVGTAGYTKYIENTNKKADMALVGNVMRAIETGASSTMFVPPEPLSFGTTSYPIGFVALNTEESSVLSSASTSQTVSGDCEYVTEEITYLTSSNRTFYCTSDSSHSTVLPVYSKHSNTITYCKAHSAALPIRLESASTNEYPTDYKYNKSSFMCLLGHKATETAWLSIPANTLLIDDVNKLYTATSNGLCSKAANPGLNFSTEPETNGILYDAIYAAFGTGDLNLKYDSWGTEGGANYATFYTYAPNVFNNVKDQTALLIGAVNSDLVNGLAQVAGINLNSYLTEGTYDNSAQLLDSFSTFVSTNMTEEEWMNAWNQAANDSDEYTFNLDAKGAKNDYIWAARMAYNSSFASYCDASGIESTYTDLIVNYGDDELGGAIHIPSIANKEAFSQTGEGSLKQSFIDKDGTNGAAIFEQCNNLYLDYISSSACAENGKVFYNTVKTLEQTGDVAMETGDYFGYYNNYLNEMSNLYTKAQEKSQNGIMIIVTMEDGVVKCDVSPAAANPRNK